VDVYRHGTYRDSLPLGKKDFYISLTFANSSGGRSRDDRARHLDLYGKDQG